MRIISTRKLRVAGVIAAFVAVAAAVPIVAAADTSANYLSGEPSFCIPGLMSCESASAPGDHEFDNGQYPPAAQLNDSTANEQPTDEDGPTQNTDPAVGESSRGGNSSQNSDPPQSDPPQSASTESASTESASVEESDVAGVDVAGASLSPAPVEASCTGNTCLPEPSPSCEDSECCYETDCCPEESGCLVDESSNTGGGNPIIVPGPVVTTSGEVYLPRQYYLPEVSPEVIPPVDTPEIDIIIPEPETTEPGPPVTPTPVPLTFEPPTPEVALAPAGLQLSRPAIGPGGQVTATGMGCAPAAPVELSINDIPVGSTVAQSDGTFETELHTGTVDVGRYDVTAQCDRTLTAPLEIVLASHVGTGASAFTLVLVFLILGAWFYGHQLASHLLPQGHSGSPVTEEESL